MQRLDSCLEARKAVIGALAGKKDLGGILEASVCLEVTLNGQFCSQKAQARWNAELRLGDNEL